MANNPAVSVVIPMYNAEKYIGDCLESILNQTFTDFEVIVVDDCSTDNSCAVVESYIKKFGGRLKLYRMKKNSGYGSLPRNKGVTISRGEYIFFMDADDAITPTAFAELYPVAKNFNADVVHCEKYYNVPDEHWNDAEFLRQIKPYSYQRGEFVTKPTLLTEDLAVRTELFYQKKFIHSIWTNLFRRDFILENEIKMPNIAGEDMIFLMCVLCTAKIYVIVPNVINFYRIRENSVSTEKIDAVRKFRKWFRSLQSGFKYFDEFLSERGIFSQRPDLKYFWFDTFWREICMYFNGLYCSYPAITFNEALRAEFRRNEDFALASFVFETANIQRINAMINQQRFNQFAAQAQKRIAELENDLKRLKS